MKCPRCLFEPRVCLCAELPTVIARTQVVIVRHHLERHRSSNSGRLAHLALPNSVIVEHPGGAMPPLDGAWLVYPVGPAQPARLDLGPEGAGALPAEPPRRLVVLDATWSQARRMYRKLDALRGLPILRLPDAPMPEARLRESPAPGRVSTIEAIARALRLVEGDEVAAPLERLFELAVERARSTGRSVVHVS